MCRRPRKLLLEQELYESLSRLPRPSGNDAGGAPATGSYSNVEFEASAPGTYATGPG